MATPTIFFPVGASNAKLVPNRQLVMPVVFCNVRIGFFERHRANFNSHRAPLLPFDFGTGGWSRTSTYGSQSPVPYLLATPA